MTNAASTRCCKCGVEVSTDITGDHATGYGPMCDDCYYAALGALVEEHPICNPEQRQ